MIQFSIFLFQVFNEFKKGSYDILIATDLIARGIDIPDCEMVIQVCTNLSETIFFLNTFKI